MSRVVFLFGERVGLFGVRPRVRYHPMTDPAAWFIEAG